MNSNKMENTKEGLIMKRILFKIIRFVVKYSYTSIEYDYKYSNGKVSKRHYANLYNPLSWLIMLGMGLVLSVYEFGRFLHDMTKDTIEERRVAKRQRNFKTTPTP